MSARRRLAVLVYGLAILALTLAPVPDRVSSFVDAPDLDKLVHAVMFGGLGFLACWALGFSRALRTVVLALLLAWGMAGLVEFLQGLVPYRMPDLADFVAGALGAVAGVAAFAVGAALLRRRVAAREAGGQSELTDSP